MWYLILLQSPRIYVVHLSRFKTIKMYFFLSEDHIAQPYCTVLQQLAEFSVIWLVAGTDFVA